MALNITKEVANMERLSVGALCERYREVFGEDTKARNKQWLIKRIAWKLQANEEGDISERARKLAMEIAQSSDIRTSAPKIRTRPIEATFETATTIITPPADTGFRVETLPQGKRTMSADSDAALQSTYFVKLSQAMELKRQNVRQCAMQTSCRDRVVSTILVNLDALRTVVFR